MKCNAVVFIGCGYPMGGVLFMAHMGCALYRASMSHDFDLYFAAVSQEGQIGFWDIVSRQIDNSAIIKMDTFAELAERVVALTKRYKRVIVHTGGGWGQTKHFVKARKRIDKMLQERLIFIGTTHSYRNDSFLRIPVSAVQYVLYRLYYQMIVFQCKYAADRFVGGNHLIKLGKGVVVPLGCEPFREHYESVPIGIRGENELLEILQDGSLFKFVYLAAFRPGKKHCWLIRAIAPALKKNPQAMLLLCGGGNMKVRERVEKVIADEGLENQVKLPGQIERNEIPWLLSKCNCAIVPSRAETFGHNFIEPMFAGLPVVGTDVGIGREVVKDGETGFHISLMDKRGVSMIANKMINNPDVAKYLGKNAFELVRRNFTHDAVAAQLVPVYESFMK